MINSPLRLAFAVTSCLSAVLLAGCPANNSGEDTGGATTMAGNGGAPPSPGKQLKLAFVTNNSSDFWTIARKGVEKADAELTNATIEFKMPTQGTAADQTRLINDLISKGVQGFAMSPVDPANQTPAIDKWAAQSLVFTQDSDAPNSKRACYVGTDNKAAGRQAGEQIKKSLPNGGDIMLFVGKIDAQNAKDRADGIKEAIRGTKIKIIDIRTDDTKRDRAKANVSDAIVKYPNIAGMMGLWSYNGPAILNAVRAAGKAGKIKIVCFDEEDDTLAGVKSGDIDCTIVQQPYKFGYESMKLMAKVLGGDKNAIPTGKQIIVPTVIIDKSGVDKFKTELAKLRS